MLHPRTTLKPLSSAQLESEAQRLAKLCIEDKDSNQTYIELHKIDDNLSRRDPNALRARITQLIKQSRTLQQ